MPLVRLAEGGRSAGERRWARRRRGRVVGLSAPARLLRAACEAALEVARAGQVATPAVPAPRPLRPLLGFAKLGDPALATVRRTLDGDPGFRSRVLETLRIAGLLDELDEASRTFLERPEGWEATLEALGRSAVEGGERAAAAKAEVAASRRLEVVQAALDRAEQALATATGDLAAVRAEVVEGRRTRRIADSDLGRLRKRVAALEAGLASAEPPAAGAADGGRGAIEHLQAALAAAEARAERSEAAARAATAAPGLTTPPEVGPAPPAGAGVRTAVDPDAAADAVEAAVAAVAALAEALGKAVGALGIDRHHEAAWPPPGTIRRPGPGGVDAASPGRRYTDGTGRPRRTPSPLPPAVFDDTGAAADHLLRLPGVLVLVDGYNVTLSTKGQLDLGTQRRWLLDAAAGVASRTGAAFEVVFDGAAATRPAEGPRRLGVQVRFTAAGEEADDVLLDLAAGAPLVRPVVVVSDDRRVRDGARRLGANTLGVRQLAEALRR